MSKSIAFVFLACNLFNMKVVVLHHTNKGCATIMINNKE